MTTLNSFYAQAAALTNLDQRRWALGAAYRIGEYVGFGYSIPAARALVLAAPQYANGLAAAGLDDDYALIDEIVAPSFAPTDLSGLLAWYKADALALADTAAVTSWTDSSGNTRPAAQATGANQPTFRTAQVNSKPAVSFDGANDYLATAAFASPTAGATVFAVLNLTASTVYRTLVNHAAAATWATPYSRVLARVQDSAGGAHWQWIVDDATIPADAVQEAGAAPTATWQTMVFHYDQTALNIYRAAANVATKAKTGAMTSSTQPLFVGADTAGGENWNGMVAEIVYYGRGLNGTELSQVVDYLQAKYVL